MGCKTILDGKALGRWERLAKQGLHFPPFLDSQLADPSPSAPQALLLQRWEDKEN